ncbi:Lrp/AsnC family transcriptional regulator [Tistrella bauzanensis]|jgi:DNA-binding Lrp family transcriptional regulator|uniref:Lrp/AsnC family transcriptional regulator n=2 Tax=Tistrella TaxID=171436 RepID=A0ABU9YQE6_9PROT|nr:Lrp/AsnC family transcriptional regulator [Tistrella bauzanensis]GGB45570.1 AsnC family transcriptional regulator [Tistrella bauzanensis]
MAAHDLDDINRALIAALKVDARMPVAALARQVGLSRTALRHRLAALEATGVIRGYRVEVGTPLEPKVRAHVMIELRPKLGRQVIQQLKACPEVTALHAVSGPFDLLALVGCGDLDRLNALIDRIAAFHGVERTRSAIVLEDCFAR